MRILWLITARSGSKSIINKNIKMLHGLPLLAYRIKSAKSLSKNEVVWISTDSLEYSKIAHSFGAIVPFLRPKELANDEASSNDVVLHAMNCANNQNLNFDAIGLLEPTSPFITATQLKKSVEILFNQKDSENIVASKIVRPHTYFVQDDAKFLSILANRFKLSSKNRRQDRKDEITPCGGFYIAKWDSFLKNKTFYTEKTLSFTVPELNSLEIDEQIDWLWAEFILEKSLLTKKEIFTCTH